jgi:hypothetical protein
MALDILQSSSFDPCTTASVRLTASVFMMRFALGAGLVLLQPCATAAGNNAVKGVGRKTAEQIRELLSYQAAGHPNAQ